MELSVSSRISRELLSRQEGPPERSVMRHGRLRNGCCRRTSYRELYHFKLPFGHALVLAIVVYPAARVDATAQGVTLKPPTAGGAPDPQRVGRLGCPGLRGQDAARLRPLGAHGIFGSPLPEIAQEGRSSPWLVHATEPCWSQRCASACRQITPCGHLAAFQTPLEGTPGERPTHAAGRGAAHATRQSRPGSANRR
jgi:hypothetical protein